MTKVNRNETELYVSGGKALKLGTSEDHVNVEAFSLKERKANPPGKHVYSRRLSFEDLCEEQEIFSKNKENIARHFSLLKNNERYWASKEKTDNTNVTNKLSLFGEEKSQRTKFNRKTKYDDFKIQKSSYFNQKVENLRLISRIGKSRFPDSDYQCSEEENNLNDLYVNKGCGSYNLKLGNQQIFTNEYSDNNHLTNKNSSTDSFNSLSKRSKTSSKKKQTKIHVLSPSTCNTKGELFDYDFPQKQQISDRSLELRFKSNSEKFSSAKKAFIPKSFNEDQYEKICGHEQLVSLSNKKKQKSKVLKIHSDGESTSVCSQFQQEAFQLKERQQKLENIRNSQVDTINLKKDDGLSDNSPKQVFLAIAAGVLTATAFSSLMVAKGLRVMFR